MHRMLLDEVIKIIIVLIKIFIFASKLFVVVPHVLNILHGVLKF